MGTRIATDTAASFPERVSKLVLMEGIGTQTSAPDEAPTVLRKAVEDMKKASAKRKPVYDNRDDAILARSQAIGGISLDAAAHICSRGLENVADGFTWRSDPRLKMSSAIRLTEEMVEAHLRQLTMPVLLVRGLHSFFAATQTLQQRAAKIPHCQRVDLPGNHHLHLELETSAAVAEAVQNFLQQP